VLYLTGEGIAIVILEKGNIDEILKGRPAKTPDGKIIICFTPDPVWLADKIQDTSGDAAQIGRLIEEASKRPQRPANRPTHEKYIKSFLGKQDTSEEE
jgi:hypothetical protein